MNNRQRKVLEALFKDPINGNIEWRKIEGLLIAIGAEMIEGGGSRVTFLLNGAKFETHRPHPNKEALRYRVRDVRQFLMNVGVMP